MVLEIVLRVFFEAKAPGQAVKDVGRQLIHGNGAALFERTQNFGRGRYDAPAGGRAAS